MTIILEFMDPYGEIGFTEADNQESADQTILVYENLGYKLLEQKSC